MVDGAVAPDGALEQRFTERLPHPALRDVISCVFVQEISPTGAPYRHRTAPSGSLEISYRLGSALPVVVGARRDPDVSTLEPGSSVVGLRFRPGAAHPILGVPVSELTGRREQLDLLWGRSAEDLGRRIDDVTSTQEATVLLERAIVERAAGAEAADPLVAELVERLQPRRARRVADQTSDLFLSPRQLRRRCLDALGLGPKTLHRILRFHGFLALADRADDVADLAGLALAAGYADQAHLTRESVRMSGLPPRAFLSERAVNCVGVHDHAATAAPLRRALAAAVA